MLLYSLLVELIPFSHTHWRMHEGKEKSLKKLNANLS